jgi:hypothetical protein
MTFNNVTVLIDKLPTTSLIYKNVKFEACRFNTDASVATERLAIMKGLALPSYCLRLPLINVKNCMDKNDIKKLFRQNLFIFVIFKMHTKNGKSYKLNATVSYRIEHRSQHQRYIKKIRTPPVQFRHWSALLPACSTSLCLSSSR